ncbi:hypothetical protein [Sinomicrobium sp. M5D2P9]
MLLNLERVVTEAGYDCKNIVRLNIHTTSTEALWTYFKILRGWVEKPGMEQGLTLLEVVSLLENLTVDFEDYTVVK